MPAASAISWSESTKGTCSSAASRLPTLVLPAPISPTSAIVRASRGTDGEGRGGSIMPIAV